MSDAYHKDEKITTKVSILTWIKLDQRSQQIIL